MDWADVSIAEALSGAVFAAYDLHTSQVRLWRRRPGWEPPRPFCGARARMGAPCRARCEPGRGRCRFHGGLSTGPRTEEGRARIAESNRRRARERAAGV